MGPSPAFFEFIKIMFVKLWEDKKLHDDPNIGPLIESGNPIPRDRIRFSVKWIESQDTENPINSILFHDLSRKLEESIKRKAKKRIFDEGENITSSSATVKEVVSKMQDYDLFGIDEDLNGRLFETFLNATMRGKDLGQFFTPRSIVKLMTKLATPKATRDHVDKVLDGCCGTGGFLIELLTEMRNQVRENKSLTTSEKDRLLSQISNDSIFGMDLGKEPPIARIARINMYLHGDGGSKIYSTDGLDKSLKIPDGISPEQKIELEELQSLLLDQKLKFDLILTNPPFSKDYSEKLPNQNRVMEEYDLYKYGMEDTSKHRATLRSSIMFLERYSDLLEKGNEDGKRPGKLLTVMDDSILSGKKYRWARKFIRDKFIIRAVISLPGDAFQRAGARSKTSILFLMPRAKGDNSQPDVFMTESMYIGLDDVVQKTPPSKVLEAKTLAENEINRILGDFKRYLDGEKDDWLVSSDRIKERLDVKYCLPRKNDISSEWRDRGLEVLTLSDVVEPVDDAINVKDLDGEITLLKITYDGSPERGETHLVNEVSYKKLFKIKKDDLVISNIAAAYGSVAVISDELTDLLVSSEYTILRIKDTRFYPYFLWGYLRSSEVCARMLSNATGISRHRVAWDEQRKDDEEVGMYLKDLPVPYISDDLQKEIAEHYKTAIENIRVARLERNDGDSSLNSILDLNNEWAVNRLRAAKPPK
jgi:type I restriction enzyme M protein